jgi:hypothetical protein
MLPHIYLQVLFNTLLRKCQAKYLPLPALIAIDGRLFLRQTSAPKSLALRHVRLGPNLAVRPGSLEAFYMTGMPTSTSTATAFPPRSAGLNFQRRKAAIAASSAKS